MKSFLEQKHGKVTVEKYHTPLALTALGYKDRG